MRPCLFALYSGSSDSTSFLEQTAVFGAGVFPRTCELFLEQTVVLGAGVFLRVASYSWSNPQTGFWEQAFSYGVCAVPEANRSSLGQTFSDISCWNRQSLAKNVTICSCHNCAYMLEYLSVTHNCARWKDNEKQMCVTRKQAMN